MTLLKVQTIGTKGEGGFSLKDISFSQRKLERIAIAGETGAGKSTLLRIIAGLADADEGEVVFAGKRVTGPENNLVPGHPGIAYLSQHFELQKFLRVEQVIAYANTLSTKTANRLFEVCQIDHLLQRRTDQLSGGEKQRIAICRLLITSPKLLLLDEPFSHLDMVHKITLKSVIRDIGDKLKISCILVSHDPLDTLPWADKLLVMKDGRIVQNGNPEALYSQPVNEYAGGLFGKYNILSPAMYRNFAGLPALKRSPEPPRGKMAFLRPEHLKLTAKKNKGLRGKVVSKWFFGAYCEYEVSLGKTIVTVRTEDQSLREEDPVFVTLAPEHVWFV